jgi:hypothetical protein
MFHLENNVIKKGNNNLLLVCDSVLEAELLVALSMDNNKRVLPYKLVNEHVVSISLYVEHHADYGLYIRNNHETTVLPLIYQREPSTTAILFTSEVVYKNGMLYLHIRCDKIIRQQFPVNITGDLNSVTQWKVGERTLTVPFVRLVRDKEILVYSINNQPNAACVVNKDYFPKAFIKTTKGLKLSVSCGSPLRVMADQADICILSPEQREVRYTWSGRKTFGLYYEDTLLFEQSIQGERSLPKLVVAQNPTRLKIGFPILEKVEVSIKGITEKLFIEAGKTELEIEPPISSNMTEIQILTATNVILEQTIWRFRVG